MNAIRIYNHMKKEELCFRVEYQLMNLKALMDFKIPSFVSYHSVN